MFPSKLVPGRPFDYSARSHSDFAEAAEDLRARQLEIPILDVGGRLRDRGIKIAVKNMTYPPIVIPWHGIVGIGKPRHRINETAEEKGFRREVYCEGLRPVPPNLDYQTGNHWDGFGWRTEDYFSIGIAEEPINPGKVGDVVIEGIVQARVYINGKQHEWVRPIKGNVNLLETVETGPIRLFWREDKYGEVWALVWLRDILHVRCFELLEDIVPIGDGTGHKTDVFAEGLGTGEETDVYMPIPTYYGIGRKRTQYNHGTINWDIWRPSANVIGSVEANVDPGTPTPRWEVLSGIFKKIAVGIVYCTEIDTDEEGDVKLWWENQEVPQGIPYIESDHVLTAYNFGPKVKKDDKVSIAYDGQEDRWFILPCARAKRADSTIKWAKVMTGYDWEENGGDPYVYCGKCSDRFGNDLDTENPFYVYLPRKRGQSEGLDPSVYEHDIIQYALDDNDDAICQSDYLWSKIGDLKWQKADERIPKGWRVCDGQTGEGGQAWDMKHRVLMHHDESGPEEYLGSPGGGFRWHGMVHPDEGDNNHEPHPPHYHPFELYAGQTAMCGTDFETVQPTVFCTDVEHTENCVTPVDLIHGGPFNGGDGDTDNRMPFKPAVLIERYK